MQTIQWHKTDIFDLATRRGKEVAPKKNKMMLSPYDVPNAVGCYQDGNKIIVEFRYISIKEKVDEYIGLPNDGISFGIGDTTKRIYKIMFDTAVFDAANAGSLFENMQPLELAVEDVISHQESLNKHSSKYSAALAALKDVGGCFQQLATQK